MASVHVNQKDWTGLSQDDKDKIAQILQTSGLIRKGDSLTGSDAPMTRDQFAAANPACMFGCNAAEAVAVAACAGLGPIAAPICVAAAHAAADYCRSRC